MSQKGCSVEGCDKTHRARGYCHTHYVAARREGTIEKLDVSNFHRIVKVTDLDAKLGICQVCGPDTPMWLQGSGRVVCGRVGRERAAKRRQRPDVKEYHRKYNLARSVENRIARYGLTEQRWQELLDECGEACSICSTPLPSLGSAHVDHDHSCCPRGGSCGECVRGLLCASCNIGLGSFRDSPELLTEAKFYLIRHSREAI